MFCVLHEVCASRPVSGQRKVGDCLYNGMGTGVDFVPSAKYYKAAAEAGDELALCSYGYLVLVGIGVERNAKVAVDLFEIAARAGSINALVRLGECYLEGWVLKKTRGGILIL